MHDPPLFHCCYLLWSVALPKVKCLSLNFVRGQPASSPHNQITHTLCHHQWVDEVMEKVGKVAQMCTPFTLLSPRNLFYQILPLSRHNLLARAMVHRYKVHRWVAGLVGCTTAYLLLHLSLGVSNYYNAKHTPFLFSKLVFLRKLQDEVN